MRPMLVTVIIALFPGQKPTVFRNIQLDEALSMVAGRRHYKLVFGPNHY
jgi:hypothetical protein